MPKATQIALGGTKEFQCRYLCRSPVFVANATQTALGGKKQFL
jgi:hypothetical protein